MLPPGHRRSIGLSHRGRGAAVAAAMLGLGLLTATPAVAQSPASPPNAAQGSGATTTPPPSATPPPTTPAPTSTTTSPTAAAGQDLRFFRIGTGSTSGSYFPIGGIIASAISNPPGSRECDKGGSCGVPGLLAVAQSTQGPIENIALMAKGTLRSALAQADLAYWAFHGTGLYAGKGAVKNLRAIASLYPEMIHIVVRARSDIQSIRDLKLRRVSLGEEGSGTLVNARAILKAYGMSELDVVPFYLQPGPAADLLANDGIDAFFLNAGLPAQTIADLARKTRLHFLSIGGDEVGELLKSYPFFAPRIIPGGTYEGVAGVETLAIGVQYLVAAETDEKLVYGITQALWHPSTEKLWENVGSLASSIKLEHALEGLGIPLHPGAALFYFEKGMVQGDAKPAEKP